MIAPLSKIVHAVDGRLTPGGDGALVVTGISTDSRTTAAGNLFIPLRGPNFDGHDFIPAAIGRGAAATLCEHPVSGLEVPQIVVDDTLKALGDLASFWRRQFQLPLAAVTGSSGKTTTKEMLAAILKHRGTGLKTSGNLNNLIGLPLTLCQMQSKHQWAVLEMGMSARGEIRRLAEIAGPTIGIVTNIAPAHLLTLKDIEGVARAKGELFAALPPGAVAVINSDDPYVRNLPVANGVRKVRYGLEEQNGITATGLSSDDGSIRFELATPHGRETVRLPLPGRHNVLNALAATAAALEMGCTLPEIKEALAAFQPVSGRLELIRLRDGIVLLRDVYNANPLSMRAALNTLDELGGPGQRIAVLGDMLELGEASPRLHREVGELAAQRCDRLLILGSEAREIATGALAAGMATTQVTMATTHSELLAILNSILRPADRLLVKGSRGMKMELVTDPLITALTTAPKGD